MFYKKLGITLFIFTAFLVFVPKAQAFQNFHTSYKFTYNLSNSQSTFVNLNISIKNNTTKFYVNSYKLQFGFSDMKNVSVTQNNQKIPFKINPSDSGTQLEIDFKDKVVGIGKERNFLVAFDTSDVSQNKGTVWEVNIPGAQKYSPIDDYSVVINFPQKMGNIAYIKPAIKNLNFDGKTMVLNNNQIKESGISIAFGEFQVYDLTLTYHLKNGNFFPITSSIALPHNTSYQDVLIDRMDPKPLNVVKDGDGNWIATYKIPSAKNIDVKVYGKARVFLNPRRESISQYGFEKYLKPQNYWESQDPKISDLGKKLKTPKAIYDYTVSTLKYDFSRVKNSQERQGASKVLSNPESASCWEFTDLFIALARSGGIPAREVIGFAYTTNSKERPLSLIQDVLHAWPQYYDASRGTWINVDPTWGNTTSGIDYFNTFDFDHIAFVTQGLSSTSPTPPGGFGDIKVTPAYEFNQKLSSITFDRDFEKKYVSGLTMLGRIKVENIGNSITPPTSVIITDEINNLPQNIKVEEIPPFGYQELKFDLGKVGFLTKYEGKAKIQLGSVVFYETFVSSPIFTNTKFYVGGIIFGLLTIAVFIGYRRTRSLSS